MAEPRLPPELLDRYRALPSKERRRLLKDANEVAAGSVAVDATRNFEEQRDAHLELVLTGRLAQLEDATRQAFLDPGPWQAQWSVVAGQDDPPDGPWGWMIMHAGAWPPVVVERAAVTYATEREARAAGEGAAAALWSKVNRQLAGG